MGIEWSMRSCDVAHNSSYYFIGIGGVSMSALACLLQARGALVRGSDAAEGEFTAMMKRSERTS